MLRLATSAFWRFAFDSIPTCWPGTFKGNVVRFAKVVGSGDADNSGFQQDDAKLIAWKARKKDI